MSNEKNQSLEPKEKLELQIKNSDTFGMSKKFLSEKLNNYYNNDGKISIKEEKRILYLIKNYDNLETKYEKYIFYLKSKYKQQLNIERQQLILDLKGKLSNIKIPEKFDENLNTKITNLIQENYNKIQKILSRKYKKQKKETEEKPKISSNYKKKKNLTKEKQTPNSIEDLIVSYLKEHSAQMHIKKGLENYKKLPKKIKENLGKLVQIFDNIDWGIIGGLGIKESKFEISAKSSKGAKGIFQVKIFEELKKHYNSTNKYKGPEEKFLADLKKNPKFIEVYREIPREALGIAFLSYLIKKYNGDLIKAFGYYNSGQDNFKKWGKETKEYVYGPKSILKYGKVFYLAQNQLNN